MLDSVEDVEQTTRASGMAPFAHGRAAELLQVIELVENFSCFAIITLWRFAAADPAALPGFEVSLWCWIRLS